MRTKKEGDIYKIIEFGGHRFEIRYGFYEEYVRKSKFGELIPIYPDFTSEQKYTNNGHPFVTQMQNICEHAKTTVNFEPSCVDCYYFCQGEDLIGFCKCDKRNKNFSPPLPERTSYSTHSEENI